jgi:hypothetical protein
VDSARRKSSEANNPNDFIAPWAIYLLDECKQWKFIDEQYPECSGVAGKSVTKDERKTRRNHRDKSFY